MIIPDSAHGTNPASVTLGGYEVVTVPSDERGCVDMAALAAVLDEDVAGIMLTNPNTLGLFEEDIAAIAAAVHEVGRPALLRRRQPQRHPRRGAPGRHGLRHRPHEPAQDLRHPPRRGRPGCRPGGRLRAAGPVPPRPPGGAGRVGRPGAGLRVGRRRPGRSAGCTPGTATPWSWPGPWPTSWPTGGTGCGGSPRPPCSTPTGSVSG